MRKITYKNSGVDIKKADDFVKGIKSFLFSGNLNKVAAFGCPFDLAPFLKKYKKPVLVSSTDGVGTKLKIAQKLNAHAGVGIDLVAMNTNDIVCLGAKPLFFLDYIACGKVKPAVLKEVVSGIHKGLKESACALVGGETAQMPGMYAENEYDLAGFCVGIVDKDRIINGSNIKEGDSVIGLASNGLHSNGFSLARKALGDKGIKKYADELLKPTRIYVKPILSLLRVMSYELRAIKGIAHVTGGAFYNKVIKILPKNYAMLINKNSWHAPEIFRIIQQKGNIEDKEMYSVFNMGIGLVLVVARKQADRVMHALIVSKINCQVIGHIVKADSPMIIK
jgi:phosphoribosylformylglycinamidine cyclo-ligase